MSFWINILVVALLLQLYTACSVHWSFSISLHSTLNPVHLGSLCSYSWHWFIDKCGILTLSGKLILNWRVVWSEWKSLTIRETRRASNHMCWSLTTFWKPTPELSSKCWEPALCSIRSHTVGSAGSDLDLVMSRWLCSCLDFWEPLFLSRGTSHCPYITSSRFFSSPPCDSWL